MVYFYIQKYIKSPCEIKQFMLIVVLCTLLPLLILPKFHMDMMGTVPPPLH